MAVVACPDSRTLAAFARGELDGPELIDVSDHVSGCAACCRALQAMPSDTLAGLARDAAARGPLSPESTPPPDGPAPAPTPTGRIPVELQNHPRYRILEELGRGGMGTVYKAEDTWMSRTVALKVVSTHLTVKASALARFKKEVQAAAQLAHNNIVRAYDTGEVGGAQFLVMEYVEGLSLDRLVMRKGRVSVQLACNLMRQAAMGLQHAADKGMVHRDIKPQNLLVTKKGQVKILDFGLARLAAGRGSDASGERVPFGAANMSDTAAAAGVTQAGYVVGTVDYLSPEQAKNASEVDSRSDIYSLGCTLYYLLAARPPFAAVKGIREKLAAHAKADPPSVRLERLEVTEELEAVIRRMLAKKPADRYQTPAEVAAALLPFTRDGAAKEPAFEVVGDPVAPSPASAVSVGADGPSAPTVISGVASVDAPAPRPRPVAAAVVLDDDPEPAEPEAARPRKKKRKRASWWERHGGRAIGACVALTALAVIAFAAVRIPWSELTGRPAASAKAPDAPAKGDSPSAAKPDKTEKPPVPPTVIAPKPAAVRVLYVLPPTGVHLSDYEPVRARLERKGVQVVTATPAGGSARADAPGPDIPIDVRLMRTLNAAEYAAVVFAGGAADEYIGTGAGAADAKWLIEQMQTAGKPVAAIGVGIAVPAYHGVLRDKRVAHSTGLWNRYSPFRNPWLGNASGIRWERSDIVIDGRMITAMGDRDTKPDDFADAVLRAIEGAGR
jgi:serine/threonine-protein kinase